MLFLFLFPTGTQEPGLGALVAGVVEISISWYRKLRKGKTIGNRGSASEKVMLFAPQISVFEPPHLNFPAREEA